MSMEVAFSRQLTAREIDVLKLLASGFETADIMAQLNMAKGTVFTHRNSIGRKLGSFNLAKLTLHAVKLGLVKP